MLSKITSATTVGLDGVRIQVEVDVAERGFPTFTIVGLPSKAIDESKERVRTAIKNAGYQMPESKIVVNLAPADIPKEGSLFDLPIAVGILTSSGMIAKESVQDSLFVGELSLDGKIRRVPGVLPITLCARAQKIQNLFVPLDNAQEAAIVSGIDVYPADSLLNLVLHLNNEALIGKSAPIRVADIQRKTTYEHDFSDVKGQEQAKRALIIAAAGFHNVHLKGPPGAGKTLLARTFPSILPDMDEDEIIEVSKIYSISGIHTSSGFVVTRPFRAPHHTISRVGLIGGGAKLTPGEISLSHRGVLFLDEFPEFPRNVLESLRQPLEDGIVSISRAVGSVLFPSRFLLLAASNPCPCGFLGSIKRQCKCSMGQILKYKKRVSGPLLDRIDLHLTVPAVEHDKLISDEISVPSIDLRAMVTEARERQRKRFSQLTIKSNGEMSTANIKKYCKLTSGAVTLLKQAVSTLSLSARSYFKVVKIGQTLADLSGEEQISTHHISEALQYRAQED